MVISNSFQFISLCRRVTQNDREVLKLIEKRYNSTSETYRHSDEFFAILLQQSDLILNDSSNKYIYIRNVLTELKAYR